ncbi:hypothetical protein CPB85DRAFT_403273 [Mucidula mucida]|nr:hypothetical protein CPB85DRAFT_403273 [Mucidula mucida]
MFTTLHGLRCCPTFRYAFIGDIQFVHSRVAVFIWTATISNLGLRTPLFRGIIMPSDQNDWNDFLLGLLTAHLLVGMLRIWVLSSEPPC